MKIARLVKISDLKNVEHLVKYSGKGMTTMPKTSIEIKEGLNGQKDPCLLYTSDAADE